MQWQPHNADRELETAKIPKIIHFVVPTNPSRDQSEVIRKARDAHPDWIVRIWDDSTELPDSPLGRYLPKCRSGAQFSDLVRLAVVFREGGVYLDSDMIVLRPLDLLTDSASFFIASEDGYNLTNAAFAATPQHPALRLIIEFLDNNEPDWELPPNVTTGPVLFAQLLRWRSDICIYPRETFYPYHNYYTVKKVHELSYLEHRWAGSWVKPTVSEKHIKTRLRGIKPMDLLRRLARPVINSIGRAVAQHVVHKRSNVSYSITSKMVVETIHGHQLVASGTDYSITPKLVMNGYFELGNELFVAKTLKGGDWFVDVGANIGVYSLIAAGKCGPFGRVFAFEPNPLIAELLMESAALNWVHDRVRVNTIAVSDRPGMRKLEVLHSRAGDSRIASEAPIRDESAAFEKTRAYLSTETFVEVEANRLDNLFPVNVPIKIIKIDAEGHEGSILDGARRLLEARAFDYIMVEAIMDVGQSPWSAACKWLRRLGEFGYEVGTADKDGNLIIHKSVDIAMTKMLENNLIFSAGRS